MGKNRPLFKDLTGFLVALFFVGLIVTPVDQASAKCSDLLQWTARLFNPVTSDFISPGADWAFQLPTEVEAYPLRNEYVGEELGTAALWVQIGRKDKISYMTPKQAASYQTRVEQGKFLDSKGRPLCPKKECMGLFVIDELGRLYFAPTTDRHLLHHSSFVAGRPVVFAGELHLLNGVLLTVNKGSGHYRPPLRAYKFLIELFARYHIRDYEISIPVTGETSNKLGYDHRELKESQVLKLFSSSPEVMNRKYILMSSDYEDLLRTAHF